MNMNDELIGMMECWNIGILDKDEKNGTAKKETGPGY